MKSKAKQFNTAMNTKVTISTNGCLFMGSSGTNGFVVSQPGSEAPTCSASSWPTGSHDYPAICPMNVDADPRSSGDVWVVASVANCENEFVVRYENVQQYGYPNCIYTFEAALLTNGNIEFRYFDMCTGSYHRAAYIQEGPSGDAINICGPDCSCWDGYAGNYRVLFSTNLALEKSVMMSSEGIIGSSSLATDGLVSSGSGASTDSEPSPWAEVDLEQEVFISDVVIWPLDGFIEGISPLVLILKDGAQNIVHQTNSLTFPVGESYWNLNLNTLGAIDTMEVQFVRIQLEGEGYLNFEEIQVFGVPDYTANEECLASPGYYCDVAGVETICPEGLYCLGGVSVPAVACYQGSVCPQGSPEAPPLPPSRISVMSFEGSLAVAFLDEDNGGVNGDYSYTIDYVSYVGLMDFDAVVPDTIEGSYTASGPGYVEITGVDTGVGDDKIFYKVTVTAVNSLTLQKSAPSDVVMVKGGTSECPSGSSDDLWGDVVLFNSENGQGMEQLTMIVPYNLEYVAAAECDDCNDLDGSLIDVTFSFANVNCNIPVSHEFADNDCSDVFVLSSCSEWAFARMDNLMAGTSAGNSGFTQQPIVDDEVVYETTYTAVGTFTATTAFEVPAPSRSETQIRTVTVVYPHTVEANIALSKVYGEPIREIFPVSLIEVTGPGPSGYHELVITTRTQYPYIITNARIENTAVGTKYVVDIDDTEDCTSISDAQACEQVLTIHTNDGSGFEFPHCSYDLIYELELTMYCIQDSSYASGTTSDLNCDVAIMGGCTFHVSTDFCADLSITADNVGAELKSYGDVELVDVDGTDIYDITGGEQGAFAYLNTIYYEMSISGLTDADVSIESFVVTDQSDDADEPSSFSFEIITDIDGSPVDDTTEWIETNPENENDADWIIPIYVLKGFNSDLKEDTIIFKQYVHEKTFPNYPVDSTIPFTNYLVTCTVVNNGFRRKLETNLRFQPEDHRVLAETAEAEKTVAVGQMPSAAFDDSTGGSDNKDTVTSAAGVTPSLSSMINLFAIFLAAIMV